MSYVRDREKKREGKIIVGKKLTSYVVRTRTVPQTQRAINAILIPTRRRWITLSPPSRIPSVELAIVPPAAHQERVTPQFPLSCQAALNNYVYRRPPFFFTRIPIFVVPFSRYILAVLLTATSSPPENSECGPLHKAAAAKPTQLQECLWRRSSTVGMLVHRRTPPESELLSSFSPRPSP